jgi:hypothetical protein
VEQEPTPEPLTIGGWQGRLAELLVHGEQPSGRINGSGLFMVIGPTFDSGRNALNPYVIDIMPTILHALGIELSWEFLGRNMDELYRPGWMSSNPLVYIDEYTILEPPPPEEPVQESVVEPDLSTVESFNLSTYGY